MRISDWSSDVCSSDLIGATPDDCTRQAAAIAFDVPLQRHREAERMLIEHYGGAATPNRLLMTDFPSGAGLIPNPVNQVPGFSFGHCYFVPGFPEMAWTELEGVLDTRVQLQNGRAVWEARGGR